MGWRQEIETAFRSLAYTPLVKTTRLDYKTTRISFQLVRAASLKAISGYYSDKPVEEVSRKNEHSYGRDVTFQRRSLGTLQTSTWSFKQVPAREQLKKFFVVVTRHDHPWAESELPDPENYALVVNLRDKENEKAELLQQIEVILQGRVRARV